MLRETNPDSELTESEKENRWVEGGEWGVFALYE